MRLIWYWRIIGIVRMVCEELEKWSDLDKALDVKEIGDEEEK